MRQSKWVWDAENTRKYIQRKHLITYNLLLALLFDKTAFLHRHTAVTLLCAALCGHEFVNSVWWMPKTCVQVRANNDRFIFIRCSLFWKCDCAIDVPPAPFHSSFNIQSDSEGRGDEMCARMEWRNEMLTDGGEWRWCEWDYKRRFFGVFFLLFICFGGVLRAVCLCVGPFSFAYCKCIYLFVYFVISPFESPALLQIKTHRDNVILYICPAKRTISVFHSHKR